MAWFFQLSLACQKCAVNATYMGIALQTVRSNALLTYVTVTIDALFHMANALNGRAIPWVSLLVSLLGVSTLVHIFNIFSFAMLNISLGLY